MVVLLQEATKKRRRKPGSSEGILHVLSEDEEHLDDFTDGAKQVREYGKKLEQKYGNLRLQKFVVAALGFERVCFKKLD